MWRLVVATLTLALSASLSGPAARAAPDPGLAVTTSAPQSVCDATLGLTFRPDPLVACEPATLTARTRHSCRARQVRIVYVINATRDFDGTRMEQLRWGLRESVRALMLPSNPNIHVAAVRILPDGAELVTGFTPDLGTAFQGVTAHSALYGCRSCGMTRALELLRTERTRLAPDRAVEFIAFFGAWSEGLDAAFEAARSALQGDGVMLIAANRELASSDAYWTGRKSVPQIFRDIRTDHQGATLRSLQLSVELPDGLTYVPFSAQPPAAALPDPGAGRQRVTWDYLYPPQGGLTVTLEVAVSSTLASGVRTHARLGDTYGRTREVSRPADGRLPVPPSVIDRCPQVTPEPGTPTATPVPTRVPPTPGPTPTPPGRRGVVPAFLPYVVRAPCAHSARRLDVMLVVDTSSSMRAGADPDHDALADAAAAGHAFVTALRASGDALPSGGRRLGIVRFDHAAELMLPLTDDWTVVRAALDALARAEVRPGTRIDRGLAAATDQLATAGRADHEPVIVLLTDGTQHHGRDAALARAYEARAAGIEVFTVGLGPGVNAALLIEISGEIGRYARVDDVAMLTRIYQEIAQRLRCH